MNGTEGQATIKVDKVWGFIVLFIESKIFD